MSYPFDHEDSALDAEIARVYEQLTTWGAEDEEYQKAVDQLTKLYKLKHDQSKLNLELYQTDSKNNLEAETAQFEREQTTKSWLQRVEPSTVIAVAGNLAVALVVVKYEQTGVIASKVTSFMKKI